MKTIVTHPGSAHRDEFLSCCLLIAAGEADCIERRDCTEADLENPEVIVLDQGGRHEPRLCNFDHHQFDRDADPACSITLILPYLGIDVEQARQIWDWLEFSELLDSKGPFETAKRLGSNPDGLFAGISPVETTVLRWFGKMQDRGRILISYDPPYGFSGLWEIMHRVGKEKLDYLKEVTERLDCLRENAKVVEVKGLRFVDARGIDRDDNPTLGLEIYCQQMGDNRIAGTITQDDRGDGVSLFRRKDHPRVDFSRLEGMDGVVFAHKGGFVAKLAAGVDPLPMLRDAIIPAEPETPLVLQRKQHVIDVRLICNNEPVPGWGHDPQDMADAAAVRAAAVLGSYDPIVIGCEAKDLKVEDLTDSETAAIVRHLTKE